MASALCRTTSRLRPIQLLQGLRASSDLLYPSSPSPPCISDALRHGGDSSLPRSVRQLFSLSCGIEKFKMDQRCLLSTWVSDTTSKPPKSGGEPETKSGGGSDQKHERASGKDVRGAPVSWMSFFLLFATGAGLVYYYDREKKRHIQGTHLLFLDDLSDINTNSIAVKEGPSAGKAAIGGPFSLVRDDGKRITEKDLMGKWTILYFGFTHCPDICPDELIKLSASIDKIKDKSGVDVVPVFISVDPERDTVEQVHEYVKEEEDSDYLVDHSIVMYLMSPEMSFVKFYGKNHDVDSLTDGVVKEIRQYRK
ncbi:hypothetical protein Bca101_060168 [Brassica carinata]